MLRGMDERPDHAIPPPPAGTIPGPYDAGAWGAPEVPMPVAAAPEPRRSRAVLAIVVAAAVIAVLLAVAFAVGGGTGGGLPDELAGQPRIEGGPIDEVFGAIEGMEVGGVSIEVTAYGTEADPRYLVMIFQGDVGDDAGSLLSSLPAGLVGNGQVQVDMDAALTAEQDGVEYLCAPAGAVQGGQRITMCLFQDEGTAGTIVTFTEESLPRMLEVTKGLVEGL